MPITDIRLQNFRSYTDETFEFENGVNIIVGPNASGKTNLLEAIQVSCLGNSHRSKDIELIRFDRPWARIDTSLEGSPRTVKIERLNEDKATKTFNISGQTLKSLLPTKTLPTVLFEPNHLQLLVGSPELRRDYLDSLVEQTVPGYNQTRQKYRRALSQRNSLLKKGPTLAQKQIFSWNIRLSQLAGEIIHQRLAMVKMINSEINGLYRKLSRANIVEVHLEYLSSSNLKNYETSLLRELETSLELDCLRGYTGRGPHRDDFVVVMNGHSATQSASRGETRTLLIALKIIELNLLEKTRGQKPILLLDDVFSELDGARRRALTKFLKKYQTFITTTDADVVIQHFMNEAHIIPLTK
jgi:DNA replication and repair protein RecF